MQLSCKNKYCKIFGELKMVCIFDLSITQKPHNMYLQEINKLTKPELKKLIDQLEFGMDDILKSGDIVKANKLNVLIGKCIDLYNK